ncbi:hypothetical protein KIH32_01435 [Pseudomonas fluorescens]|uniref:hypothetical protein n=1 Tax=Pseudomonas fluorescens TaxID=294 RepID=UPI001BD92141|nr:hypothetical protein [Pseudomonas fluorescens]MBT0622551.1 hypothetical protein [Pseudomonas fluorescens]
MENDDVGNEECVTVFTCRGKDRILYEGGSQAWRIDMSKASKRKYVVCVQNRNETWGQATADHKTAFLIGKISSVTKSTQKGATDRAIINISEYAELNVPDRWLGNRNPVAYRHLSDFGIHTHDDLADLSWTRLGVRFSLENKEPEEMPGDDYEAVQLDDPLPEKPVEGIKALTVEEAKAGLAMNFGISVEKIDITIRF